LKYCKHTTYGEKQGCGVDVKMSDSDSYLPNFSDSDLSKISDSRLLKHNVNEFCLSTMAKNRAKIILQMSTSLLSRIDTLVKALV